MKQKRNEKRILSFLLCLVMVFSVANLPGFTMITNAAPTPTMSLQISTDGIVTWTEMSEADHYEVLIYHGVLEGDLYTKVPSYNIKQYLDDKGKDTASYEIYIHAFNSSNQFVGESNTVSYSFRATKERLPEPKNLTWSGSVAKWSEVPNATAYVVLLNKANGEGIISAEVTEPKYDFGSYAEKGMYFTVYAEAKDYRDSYEAESGDKLDNVHSIVVRFKPGSYGLGTMKDVVLTPNSAGNASYTLPKCTYESSSGYYDFLQWDADQLINGSYYNHYVGESITLSKNITLIAQWRYNDKVQVNASAKSSHGEVTGGGYYNWGDTVTLKATPEKGYIFDRWWKSAPTTGYMSEDATYSFVLTKEDFSYVNLTHPLVLEAEFKTDPYSYLDRVDVNGYVAPLPGKTPEKPTIPTDAYYNVSRIWYEVPEIGNKADAKTLEGNFEEGKVYCLTLSFTTTGYIKFDEDVKAYVDGKVVEYERITDNRIRVYLYTKIDHDFSAYISNSDRTHKVVCNYCGAVQEGHEKDACTFDAGVVTKQPTTSAEGVKTFTCTACGYTKTEAIAKLTEDSKTDTPADKPVAPKKGATVTDKKANAVVKVTVADPKKGEVEYTKPVSSKGTIVIPDTVTISGVKYKVTSIKANAFKNNKKLKKVTIGKNIKKIGKNAFYGCKNLKTVTIKTTKLTTKKVGKNAFAKIHKKATVKVPKKKLKAYKTMLKKRGISKKTQKIKK